MVIRDLRPDDWPEVASIYHDGMRDGMATFETEVPSWDAWHEAHTLRVVAELDERVVGWAALGWLSARANSAALGGRSAGSFCSAACTAAATCGGTVSLISCSGRGRSVITLATTAWAVGPVNGGSPASIS